MGSIHWTVTAQKNLEEIATYIAIDSPMKYNFLFHRKYYPVYPVNPVKKI